MRHDSNDIAAIILNQVPLLDVRAPIEYERGTVPGAVNVPLLDDHQRELIGTEYANKGQDAAIELGLSTVTDEIRQNRLHGWTEFVENHPEGYLFCFRGGLRSKTTQAWLREAGITYPKLIGGYKAIRSYLLEQFEQLAEEGNMLVLSAPTGSGKTTFIEQLKESVDIEGLAKHRGSAFGSLFVQQPSQVSWENQVAAQWLRASAESSQPIMFESESHLIGRVSLPKFLQEALRSAPVVELITPLPDRIKNIQHDYIGTAMQKYRQVLDEEQSFVQLESFVTENLSRIERRLGGERCQRLISLVPTAIDELRTNTALTGFDEIVKTLLLDYYDPLYAHKMKGREGQVVFSGTGDEIVSWLHASYS